MPPSFTIAMPGLPDPRLAVNQLRNLYYMDHAHLVAEEAERWGWLLKEAGIDRHPQYTAPVRIHIRLHGTGRRGDVPNWLAHGSLKVLVDCLCEPKGNRQYGFGLLKDDSARWVRGMSVEVEPEGEPRTEITIESAGTI